MYRRLSAMEQSRFSLLMRKSNPCASLTPQCITEPATGDSLDINKVPNPNSFCRLTHNACTCPFRREDLTELEAYCYVVIKPVRIRIPRILFAETGIRDGSSYLRVNSGYLTLYNRFQDPNILFFRMSASH